MAWAGSPTDLDSLFRGNEYKPTLNASLRDTTSNSAVPAKVTGKNDKADGYYMLQFEAVGDFDAAQRRKAQLSASTGYTIQVVFDPPFYKLRGGGWTKRKVAESLSKRLKHKEQAPPALVLYLYILALSPRPCAGGAIVILEAPTARLAFA